MSLGTHRSRSAPRCKFYLPQILRFLSQCPDANEPVGHGMQVVYNAKMLSDSGMAVLRPFPGPKQITLYLP